MRSRWMQTYTSAINHRLLKAPVLASLQRASNTCTELVHNILSLGNVWWSVKHEANVAVSLYWQEMMESEFPDQVSDQSKDVMGTYRA